uniref:ATP Synthase subunit 8 n=1 Tax=Scirtothrips dorsalis TaxID=163899 RepID=A0A089N701_SCIDO|nr:ATP synthase F0 subunit 8 [Scirtothrips dorsalis]AIQ81001.1 ATP Synthase subunit 8 [Scirtothrips dorsalis]
MYQILPMNTANAVLTLIISLICIMSISQFWIESKSSKMEKKMLKKNFFNKSMFSLFVS